MIRIDYPDREAWRADARHGAPDFCVGSSTVPQILDRCPWGGPWDVYLRAREGIEPEVDEQFLAHRLSLEPWLVERYATRRGVEVDSRICRIVHPKLPWWQVSPDGLTDAAVVEAKTSVHPGQWAPDGTVIRDWQADGGERAIPPVYALQGLSLLEASGLDAVDYVVGVPSFQDVAEVRIIRLYRQRDLQRRLVQYVTAWRDRHLVRGERPAIDGSRSCNGQLAEREWQKGQREADPDEASRIEQMAELKAKAKAAKAAAKEAEAEAKKIQNELLAGSGPENAILAGGGPTRYRASIVRQAGRRSISLDRLESRRPDLIDPLEAAGIIRTGRPNAHIRIKEITP